MPGPRRGRIRNCEEWQFLAAASPLLSTFQCESGRATAELKNNSPKPRQHCLQSKSSARRGEKELGRMALRRGAERDMDEPLAVF